MTKFQDVFPLILGTKRPAVKWAEKWSGIIPDGAPYGLPTGPRNGVWVLDLDRKHGVDGVASLREYMTAMGVGLPDTYAVFTPSGGYHLYFLWDPERPLGNRTNILPGIDTRGKGGYVCAGGDYRISRDVPVLPAPDWLYAFVGTGKDADDAPVAAIAIGPDDPRYPERLQLGWRYLQSAPACISGQGGQKRLWEIALRLTRTYELSSDACWMLFSMPDGYNSRCEPPWAEHEARRAFDRAATEGHGVPGMFSAAALAGFGPGPQPREMVNIDDPWRQVKNPSHTYSFDVATDLKGGDGKAFPTPQQELTASLCGPGAGPSWRGVWQYDEFRNRIYAINPPMRLDAETKGLTETDLSRMVLWASSVKMKCSKDQIREAVHVSAEAARFHPVRDYLNGLPAVGKSAAEAYFTDIATRLWGALPERAEAESEYLRKMAIAAVRRIRVPGTKVDTMLILQGPQGYRKSQFCEKIFSRDFFRNQLPSLDGREAPIALEGIWGVEIAEMVSFNSAQENTKKEFLTRCVDKYRPLWAGGVIEQPRQCVFIGTTNEEDTLRDPTGARRYWICEVQRNIDLSFDRDEFWAAACALEASGEVHWLEYSGGSPSLDGKSAALVEARHEEEDPWEDFVMRFVSSEHEKGATYVLAVDALSRGVALSADKQTKRELKRVQAILRRRLGASSVRWIGNRAQRAYPLKGPASPEKVP